MIAPPCPIAIENAGTAYLSMNARARADIAARSSGVGPGVVSLNCPSAENGLDTTGKAVAPATRFRNWRRASMDKKPYRKPRAIMTADLLAASRQTDSRA